MIAPYYGQDLLGGPHRGYKPVDDWMKLCNYQGEHLHIGVMGFDSVPRCGASFVCNVPCLEMQAAFSFMVSVQLLFSLLCVTCLTPAFQLLNVLESIEVNADNSVIQDSLMFKIKRSSAPDHETPTVLLFLLTFVRQDENAKALWIHLWIVLQLVHPYFCPRNGYEFSDSYVPLKDNGMKFIHDNFVDYIMTTNDDEFKEQYELSLGCSPPNKLAYGIVWKGTKIE